MRLLIEKKKGREREISRSISSVTNAYWNKPKINANVDACSCFSPGDFHHIESHKAQSPESLGISEIQSGKMVWIAAQLKVVSIQTILKNLAKSEIFPK